jgi:hypothetical protein
MVRTTSPSRHFHGGEDMLEQRAAVSLAHLLSSQGRHDEVRDLVGPIYNWFTEGFRHRRPQGSEDAT